MPMQPEQTRQPQQAQQEQQPGKAATLLTRINSDLNQLGDLVERAQLPPEDKQGFGQLMESFMAFAQSMSEPMNQQKQQPQQMASGNVPMETGVREARPTL